MTDSITLECPNCHTDLTVPDDLDVVRCPACRQRIEVLAHLAFEWGQDLFLDTREEAIGRRVFPINKRARWRSLQEQLALGYEQTHSAIREALKGRLHENQRKAGIEIMAEISGVLANQMMTSPIESSYWAHLLEEQRGLDRLAAYKSKLEDARRHPYAWTRRLALGCRIAGLRRSLARTAERVDRLEAMMDLAEPLHARLPKAQRSF